MAVHVSQMHNALSEISRLARTMSRLGRPPGSSQNDFLDVITEVIDYAVHGGRLLSRATRQQVLVVSVTGAHLALVRQQAEVWRRRLLRLRWLSQVVVVVVEYEQVVAWS